MAELCRPDHVHLVDLSGYQRQVDYQALGEQGFCGGIVKLTEGQTLVAKLGAEHTRGLADALLLQGGYHYGTPHLGRRHDDAEREARHFVRVLRGLDRPPTLRMWLDLEEGKEVLTPADLHRWTVDWLQETHALVGMMPGLYASGRYLELLDLAELAELGVPLWIPQYLAKDTAPWALHLSLRDARLKAGTGPRRPQAAPWHLWQWTSKGQARGVKGDLDMNIAPSLEPLVAPHPMR